MPVEKKEEDAVAIEVPTENEEKKKDEQKAAEELSEEDQALKDGLELAVLRLQESDTSLHSQALQHLITEIRTSTSSMTSVPKPLKFLRPHYASLKAVYESWHVAHDLKQLMADVLSVLAMTMQEPGSRECLQFKLQGTHYDIASWGHEYVRSLSGEISEEYNRRLIEVASDDPSTMEDLMTLVDDILPFQMQHNAEAEAVDLLLEVQQLSKLVHSDLVDERNYQRVCLYLIRCADFMSDPEDLSEIFNTAYSIYVERSKHTDALRIALKMDDHDKVAELMTSDISNEAKRQMALMLASWHSNYICEDEELNELINNTRASDDFLHVATELGLMEAKTPEDIYKTHLAEGAVHARNRNTASAPVDSARANLASTYVNAFVNAGYCNDKLMLTDGNSWVYKNKDHGMISATASLGMLMMWNTENGLNHIDRYFHNNDDNIQAGACLGIGIVSANVRNESEPALALLSEHLESRSQTIRSTSILGLGIAYTATRNGDVAELLVPIVANTENANIVEVAFAALALGLIYVGSCDDDIGSTLVQRLMESSDDELNHTIARFLCLGLGLLFINKGERADAMLEIVRTVEHRMGKYAEITVETCAYAGTGNVLKIQQMLHTCAEHLTENADHQAVAVLGIALMTIGEDIGTEMSLRTFDHLLHYGGLPVRRTVPLALALLYVSNPDYAVVDQLSRLSHDQDAQVAQSAIFGLGIVSAGSNNSRVAGLLRQLADFYMKDANHLFIVRLAQGLNCLGKGLISLNPMQSDRLLMNYSTIAGVLAVLHAGIDFKGTILDKYHYLLYLLTPAMSPRFLLTVDEELKTCPITVRVGQAVETVGQAGRPKTITGFQVM